MKKGGEVAAPTLPQLDLQGIQLPGRSAVPLREMDKVQVAGKLLLGGVFGQVNLDAQTNAAAAAQLSAAGYSGFNQTKFAMLVAVPVDVSVTKLIGFRLNPVSTSPISARPSRAISASAWAPSSASAASKSVPFQRRFPGGSRRFLIAPRPPASSSPPDPGFSPVPPRFRDSASKQHLSNSSSLSHTNITLLLIDSKGHSIPTPRQPPARQVLSRCGKTNSRRPRLRRCRRGSRPERRVDHHRQHHVLLPPNPGTRASRPPASARTAARRPALRLEGLRPA